MADDKDKSDQPDKVVSIFGGGATATSETDPHILDVIRQFNEHVTGRKIVGVGWVIVVEGGACVTGRSYEPFESMRVLGGLDYLKYRINKSSDE